MGSYVEREGRLEGVSFQDGHNPECQCDRRMEGMTHGSLRLLLRSG